MNHLPFFTESLPCESCGAPVSTREWNSEHELWVGVDCSCSAPDEPIPACMVQVLEAAQTVSELCDSVKQHRAHCPVCNPKLRELPKREPGTERRQKREAA